MNSITQELKYKQSIVKYALRNGVTSASIVYKKHRKTIYRWINKYDGTIASLANKSRRPHISSNAHTESEIKLIKNYKRNNKDTRLVVLWVKLMQVGYKRSITSEHSTYESSKFVEIIVKKFKYKIEEIQTDNGFEFTKRLQYKNDPNRPKTMFEQKLKELKIKHKLIKSYTSRHNGKVERSHKKDQERFYHNKIFYSFEDLVNRAKYYIKEYNNFPMRPLKWLSPNDKYEEYIRNESSIIA